MTSFFGVGMSTLSLMITGLFPPITYWRMITSEIYTDSPLSAKICGFSFPLQGVFPSSRMHMTCLMIISLIILSITIGLSLIIRAYQNEYIITRKYGINIITIIYSVSSILLFLIVYLHNSRNDVSLNGIYPPSLEITSSNSIFSINQRTMWNFRVGNGDITIFSSLADTNLVNSVREHFDFIAFIPSEIYVQCKDDSSLFLCEKQSSIVCNLVLSPSDGENDLILKMYHWEIIHRYWGFMALIVSIICLCIVFFSTLV